MLYDSDVSQAIQDIWSRCACEWATTDIGRTKYDDEKEIKKERKGISIKSEHCHFRYRDRERKRRPTISIRAELSTNELVWTIHALEPQSAHNTHVHTHTYVVEVQRFLKCVKFFYSFRFFSQHIFRFAYFFSFSLPFSFFFVVLQWKWYCFVS